VVLAVAAVLVVLGGTWGLGVFDALSGGGFDDAQSPSARAHQRIEQELGRQDADILVLYSSPAATVDEPAFRDAVAGTLTALAGRPEVASVVSFYQTGAQNLVSADRHATYIAIQLRGGEEDGKLAALKAVTPALAAPGLRAEIGGLVPFLRDAQTQIESDIVRAEVLSLPLLLILLVFIFRGLVAAATPLLVGVLAILGAFLATRVIAQFTEVSTFAVNIITMLGLGMAIDYALFVVSRFREELAAGRGSADAIAATMATAGRTVLVSGLTVALSLASLLIFPMAFLRSMGWGGVAAVLVAMLAALTVLPALLAVLGPRINALGWSRRRVRTSATPAVRPERPNEDPNGSEPRSEGGAGWERLARSVMRRPIWYAVGVVALLGLLSAPFLRVQFGGFDERVLPVGTPSRTVTERIAAEFPGGSAAPIAVLLSGAPATEATGFTERIMTVPGVTDARVTANRDDSWLISVSYPGDANGEPARDVVQRLRSLPAPSGAEVLVGGRPAAVLDQLHGLGLRLPWMALLIGGVTMVLLFLAFGSVLLPLKAVLMNVVSIGASFGVVVWVFQDGHLAGLLDFTPTGFLEPTDLILLLAVLFGLSTDYEVFLLSRVREEWDRTGDNVRAVAGGLRRTGGIITAAALLLIIVIGGFATGGASSIKTLGVGAVVAIVIDALLVRALLVPATMRLLGRWNWWAPGPLARVYRRYGLRESSGAGAGAERAAAKYAADAGPVR
jgi:RND superfamily putative drug exporter